MPARPNSTARSSEAIRTTALLALLVALLATLLVSGTAATAEAATHGSKIVAEAAKHRGKPYSYGAAGPSRFDCSGFTMYVYSRFGKKLPHNSTQQYQVSRKIPKTAKQLGDLVFVKNSSGRITHVGIYAGSGKFWVSPKTGDVVKLQRIYSSNYVVGRP